MHIISLQGDYMQNKTITIPHKKIRVIQFIFKTYLDKTTARKYYAILNVFQSTGNEHLFNFIKEEVIKIKALPEFDDSLIRN